LGHEMHG